MLSSCNERTLLVGAAAWSAGANAPGARAARWPTAFAFPGRFWRHPSTRTEWWYATGSVQGDGAQWGFQITFFRSARPGVRATHAVRSRASSCGRTPH